MFPGPGVLDRRCLEDGGWGRTGTLWDLQDYKAVL